MNIMLDVNYTSTGKKLRSSQATPCAKALSGSHCTQAPMLAPPGLSSLPPAWACAWPSRSTYISPGAHTVYPTGSQQLMPQTLFSSPQLLPPPGYL